MSNLNQYILTWQCPDGPGVLAKVTNSLFEHGAFITETAQYSDPYSNIFFSRIVFDDRSLTVPISEFIDAVNCFAEPLNLTYRLRRYDELPKVLIAVSQYDHCLVSLLTKWKSQALPIEVVGIVSNHETCRSLADWHGVPFHYLPVTADTKQEQEAQLLKLFDDTESDLLVLARYMQILSDNLCQQLSGKAINIHHSFLPSFKGAKPYHQAHKRGVKVIGATAHYVTADLDEGPIIVQEVKQINHAFTIEKMVHLGHDLEATALSHAVTLHAEQRICLNKDKTVILA